MPDADQGHRKCIAAVAALLLAGSAAAAQLPGVADAPPPGLPPGANVESLTIQSGPAKCCSIIDLLGVPQVGKAVAPLFRTRMAGAVRRKLLAPVGKAVGLDPDPTSPAFAAQSPTAAVAGGIAVQQEQAAAEIAALKILAQADCLCYPEVIPAILASLDSCVEPVRFAALKALYGNCCCERNCRHPFPQAGCASCACYEAVQKRLRALLDAKDPLGQLRERSPRVRELAEAILWQCAGVLPPQPVVPAPTAEPDPTPGPLPDPDTAVPEPEVPLDELAWLRRLLRGAGRNGGPRLASYFTSVEQAPRTSPYPPEPVSEAASPAPQDLEEVLEAMAVLRQASRQPLSPVPGPPAPAAATPPTSRPAVESQVPAPAFVAPVLLDTPPGMQPMPFHDGGLQVIDLCPRCGDVACFGCGTTLPPGRRLLDLAERLDDPIDYDAGWRYRYNLGIERVAVAPFHLDTARPDSHLALRAQPQYGIRFPDRATYVWAPIGRGGPPFPETNLDLSDLWLVSETATGDASALLEIPLRFINPEINGDTGGLGDIRVGVKSKLFGDDCWTVSSIFRTYIPTGDTDVGLGVGHVSLEPGVLAHYQWDAYTSLHAELKFWIPVGADPDHKGEILRYGLGVSHVAYARPLFDGGCEEFALIPTAELVGWTVTDGRQTLPLGGLEEVDGSAYLAGLVGVRAVLTDRFEVGVSGGYAWTADRWYRSTVALEARVVF